MAIHFPLGDGNSTITYMPEEKKTVRKTRSSEKKKESFIAPEKEEITWRAAEYEYTEKTLTWFIVVGIVVLVIAITSLLSHNFFFAIFALLACGVIFLFARRRPDVLDFSVGERGVFAGEKLSLSFDEIEHFSIYSHQGHLDELILKKRSIVNPLVRIPLDSQTGEKVRVFLKGKMEEVEFQESLIDIISDRLGF